MILFEFLPPKNLFFKKNTSLSLACSSSNLTKLADSCDIYSSNFNVPCLVCLKHLLVLLFFQDTELLYAERILLILGSRRIWGLCPALLEASVLQCLQSPKKV